MSLTTYCEFDEVRSALGVNDLELKDSVLALPVYEMGLVRELNKISTSLTAAFSSVIAKTLSSRTEAETVLYDAVHLFSVYAVAKQVGVSLPTFAPKDIGDGKATVSRFAGEPFTKVLDGIDEYGELAPGSVVTVEAYPKHLCGNGRPAELADADKLPVLRAYLRKWAWEVGQFFEGVDKDSSDEELAAIAPGFPVFELQ